MLQRSQQSWVNTGSLEKYFFCCITFFKNPNYPWKVSIFVSSVRHGNLVALRTGEAVATLYGLWVWSKLKIMFSNYMIFPPKFLYSYPRLLSWLPGLLLSIWKTAKFWNNYHKNNFPYLPTWSCSRHSCWGTLLCGGRGSSAGGRGGCGWRSRGSGGGRRRIATPEVSNLHLSQIWINYL